MKRLKILSQVFLIAALAGCATSDHSQVVVSQAVGPDLARPRIDLGQGKGRLVVYTAREVNDPVSYFPTPSSYSIYTDDGRLLQRVDNRAGSLYQDPSLVSLPAGRYKVKGRATNDGEVLVPVVIEENKTTLVDLEGVTFPQHKPTGAGQWIRLPNGQVIGQRYE
jgi:hypothetical protein